MTWNPPSHPVERAANAFACLSLGGATAFAAYTSMPGAGAAAIGAAVGAAFVAGGTADLALRRIGRMGGHDVGGFAVAGIDEACADEQAASVERAEPQTVDADLADLEELLLDEPLPALDPDSRVIRLFQRDQPDPLPQPGELVTRIADFLGPRGERSADEGNRPPDDAHAALHLALADIRRSLRGS